jgi:hypothetical protein
MKVIWVWSLLTLNSQGLIQQSRPMQTESECLQLSAIVQVFNNNTGTLCMRHKIKQHFGVEG